jgi:hypothetical protein
MVGAHDKAHECKRLMVDFTLEKQSPCRKSRTKPENVLVRKF